MKKIDYTGQQIYYLTVIAEAGKANDGHVLWKCKCICENIIFVPSNQLNINAKNCRKSCGCMKAQLVSKYRKSTYKDLTNQRFGRLVAKEYLGYNAAGNVIWKCECDCGNKNFITTTHHLRSGNTRSCGCLKSIGETNIQEILTENNIAFKKQKIFAELTEKYSANYRYDFYLPDYNRLIEFDGEQHYQASGGWSTEENLKNAQRRDKIKNEWAKEHNIPLVRIPYWERDKITLEMIMGDQYLVKEQT